MGRGGIKPGVKHLNRMFANTGVLERVAGLDQDERAVHPDARVSFYRAFGVTPDLQIAYEQYYSGLEIGSLEAGIAVDASVSRETIPIISEAPLIFCHDESEINH